jgi:hypothetical protein
VGFGFGDDEGWMVNVADGDDLPLELWVSSR